LSSTQKKAIVFVISDFMSDGLRQTLKIAAKKHDIYRMRVRHENKQSMPNLGMVPMLDTETGVIQLDTSSKAIDL
jgi:hypothetical protein